MLRVSIITICRNSAATIERAVLSVQSQTYPNIEHIIIDGKSDDGTIDIIRKYDANIAFWSSEPDRGIADAYNKGLQRAGGDVIGILNSDDYYLGDRIKAVMDLFAAAPDLGFVFGDLEYVDDNGAVLFTQLGDPDYTSSIRYTMPSLTHPTMFVRRDVYGRVGGFDERYKVAMDYELLLRVFRAGFRGRYLPVSLAAMQVGGNSDRRCFEGYRETMQAAVEQGFPFIPAWIYCQYKCLKTKIRRRLEAGNLMWLVKAYRQRVMRRFRY